MKISKEEYITEEKYLLKVTKIIKNDISEMGQELFEQEEKIMEFKKYAWENKLDAGEMKSIMTDNDLEVTLAMQRAAYFKKLFKIQKNPYFGMILFSEEEQEKIKIYIGLTYLKDEKQHLIYDWRSPIASMYYDLEVGNAHYNAPKGKIFGKIYQKRQYKIENGKLKYIFDNSINIDDELLQEVLSSESSDKMKNIVNTIQQEQNKIIRNTDDKNLIVQGIAGSGKTSVALHRIAFLLYKYENITANNVLIFSPNNIFTEYISNVLPELGESNTMQTTFNDFLYTYITEYKDVGSLTELIEKYYSNEDLNITLTKYKLSDVIINDIDNYLREYEKNIKFTSGITENYEYYDKDYLNNLFHDRYSKLKLFDRLEEIAEKIANENYGNKRRISSILKNLKDACNIKKDYKEIYKGFYKSKYCRIILTENEINSFINTKKISYEDANIFVYIKGMLEGFGYNNLIKEIVIDEAQDYTLLQYKILKIVFGRSNFTILGDINQRINPYYEYKSLKILNTIFTKSISYLELLKTYRSSEEIINYTNKILNLSHVSAIRNSNSKDVLERIENNNLKDLLQNDINSLNKEYKSIAIITKTKNQSIKIYELLKEKCNIKLIIDSSSKFTKELVVLPAYLAKGLEFDSVIVYTDKSDKYKENEKNLFYVSATRAQHQLIVYNSI